MPVAPNQNSPITLAPVQQSDLDDLVAIRIEAMRESLERVGRFDPVRARERFLDGFEARDTRYIEAAGERVGFVVVKHHHNELSLDHLYVRPSAQGSGVGSAVLMQIFKEADAAALPIKMGLSRKALRIAFIPAMASSSSKAVNSTIIMFVSLFRRLVLIPQPWADLY